MNDKTLEVVHGINLNNLNQDNNPVSLSDKDIRDLTNKIIAKRSRTFIYIFYGIPILTVVYIIAVFFIFVSPAISKYFEIKDYFQVLDDNLNNTKTSVSNLNRFYVQKQELADFDNYLKSQIPEKGRLGLIINQLLKTASEFSLEGDIGVKKNESNNLNSGNSDNLYILFGGPSNNNKNNNNNNNNNFFSEENDDSTKNDLEESFYLKELSSGESRFLGMDIVSEASDVYVLTASLNIRGTKSKFYDFLNALNSFTPRLNIVGIEYKVLDSTSDPVIEALIKFESYVVRANPEYKPKRINIFSINDPVILKTIPVEEFDVLRDIYKIKIDNSGNTNSNIPSIPTSTVSPTPSPSEQQNQPYRF